MKQTFQPFAAFDLASRSADFIARLDDRVSQALVIPFRVVMFDELLDCVSQRRLSKQDEPSKTFLFSMNENTSPNVRSNQDFEAAGARVQPTADANSSQDGQLPVLPF